MVYKAIGIYSGSALKGLEIIYAHFQERGGIWSYELLHTALYEYSERWKSDLDQAINLPAREYLLMDRKFGQLVGESVNQFIVANNLIHRVDLIASHGHTIFDEPSASLNNQIGDGAQIAAITALPVISDLHAMDIAFGGNGAQLLLTGERIFPDNSNIAEFNQALMVALHGILRWREEYTMIASESNARRSSIGGALWLGGEA